MITPAIFQPLLRGGLTGRGKVVVGTKPVDTEKDEMKMKAAIFFDGTSNNRTNIETRMRNGLPWWIRTEPIGLNKASYAKSLSNVAILERMNNIEDADNEVSIYIEGAGTMDNMADDFVNGGGLGVGPQGVEEKVTRGIIDLGTEIKKVLKRTGKRLAHLQVDVFGFSRGAASARYFVARRTNDFFPLCINLCMVLRVPPSAVTINFVGLFDTVSSYGPEFIPNFQNDVKQLHLNIGGGAKRVVQLGAGDEYRIVFARTNIDSSIKAGVGFECIIPGAHADVGGGNEAEVVEKSDVLIAERNTLLQQEWFLPKQLPPPPPYVPPATLPWQMSGMGYGMPALTPLPPPPPPIWMAGTRTLTNHYQYIPLSLMMAFAKKHEVTFKSFARYAAYDVPSDLRDLQKLMHSHVVDAEKTHFELPPAFHWVRHKYIHISVTRKGMSSYAMGPHMANGRPERQVISDAT